MSFCLERGFFLDTPYILGYIMMEMDELNLAIASGDLIEKQGCISVLVSGVGL